MKFTFLSLLSLFFTLSILQAPFAVADSRPLALIWSGKGACNLCILGAMQVADLAGFDFQLIHGNSVPDATFAKAKIWIQPGGISVTEAHAMGSLLMGKIRSFVKQGGGYVGFCAGSFLSTKEIGTSGETGFGFIPGRTQYHHDEDFEAWQIEKVSTLNGPRWVYFAGGPQFVISRLELQSVKGQIIAKAANGHVEAIESNYGKGRVAVSGFHPEANAINKAGRLFISAGYRSAARAMLHAYNFGVINPAALWESSPYFQIDPDGNDYDYAISMLHFAASMK